MLSKIINGKSEDEINKIRLSLPKTAQNIALCIGLPATLALVDQFGGTEIRIPYKTLGESSVFYQLINAIGKPTAQKFFEIYAGDEIYIPSCAKTRRLLRDIEIIRTYDQLTQTMSSRSAMNQLASRFLLSDRAVKNIVNGPQKN